MTYSLLKEAYSSSYSPSASQTTRASYSPSSYSPSASQTTRASYSPSSYSPSASQTASPATTPATTPATCKPVDSDNCINYDQYHCPVSACGWMSDCKIVGKNKGGKIKSYTNGRCRSTTSCDKCKGDCC
jgi:hypothetical protein